MAWTTTPIAGKPADLFDPSIAPRFGLLFLHPVGQETLADNAVYTALFEQYRLACVCPAGGYSWWSNRLLPEYDPNQTAERYLLDGVLPFFQARWNLAPRAIGVFGISMGGQGALRLAFQYPKLFPVTAGIASAIDYHELYGQGLSLDTMYDSKEQCRQDTATMHVPPHDPPGHVFFCVDPEDYDWYRGNDRLHEKLNALGVAHVADLETRAGGHSWAYFNAMAERTIRFLVDGLQQEQRRLM